MEREKLSDRISFKTVLAVPSLSTREEEWGQWSVYLLTSLWVTGEEFTSHLQPRGNSLWWELRELGCNLLSPQNIEGSGQQTYFLKGQGVN